MFESSLKHSRILLASQLNYLIKHLLYVHEVIRSSCYASSLIERYPHYLFLILKKYFFQNLYFFNIRELLQEEVEEDLTHLDILDTTETVSNYHFNKSM